MLAVAKSIGLYGLSGSVVSVEVFVTGGLPAFEIVGLAGKAVKESKDRVRAAIKNCGFNYPLGRITVNLAPADLPKDGPLYDLPICVGILAATKQIHSIPDHCAFAGELSLDGSLSHAYGVLPMAMEAKKSGIKHFYLPEVSANEGAVVNDINIIPVKSLTHIADILNKKVQPEVLKYEQFLQAEECNIDVSDFSEVKGQESAKRALEIAAAGGHHVLLLGPPGSGKSMLSKAVASILPPMSFEESLECTMIHSIAGALGGQKILKNRPFRSVHHTVSAAGLVGGGTIPAPGELSLAHNGVLFLDELPEFSKSVLESLRQPLENGEITISRAKGAATFPCNITFICAMNPCRCGNYGSNKPCICSVAQINNYLSRVSGPMLDRIDMHVEVMEVSYDDISKKTAGESSKDIRQRVVNAREIQKDRFKGMGILTNSRMSHGQIKKLVTLTDDAEKLLKKSYESNWFSARGYDRLLKVARTCADLDNCETVELKHIAEALQYRSLDRKYWQTKIGI